MRVVSALVVAAFLAGCVVLFTSATTAPMERTSVLVQVDKGHGSGVHIGKGLFLTAAHVTAGAANGHLRINGSSGEVLWANEAYDVALVFAPNAADMPTAVFNCGAPELSVGESIEAVGNPLALRDIHTWGRISRATGEPYPGRFIADLTIGPGNSGGPVYDSSGRLAGIAVAMAAAQVGFGTSILPISYIVPMSAICRLLGRS